MISPGVPEGKPEPRRPLGEKGAEAPPSGPDPACVRTPSLIILVVAAYLPPPSPTLCPYRSPSPLLFGVFLSGTVSVNTVLIMISTGNRSPERVSPTRANKNLPAIPCHRLPCPPPTRSGNVTLRGPRPRGLPAAQAGTRSSGWGQGRGWLAVAQPWPGSSLRGDLPFGCSKHHPGPHNQAARTTRNNVGTGKCLHKGCTPSLAGWPCLHPNSALGTWASCGWNKQSRSEVEQPWRP